MIEQQNFAHPDLDALPEDVLEQMLVDAERTLRDIRGELRNRRTVAHTGIDLDLPQHDLNEARGRWTYFIEFIREMNERDAEAKANQRDDDGEQGHLI
ncbi:hypothetical protein [Ornithinimicrobium sp. INDO-MA30-4]|uniref:hypothetical protein n=1 Tax=Ornithinimicrobium sp. INDO-MA30-4 TaxID=2908651 RepID=UPI001F315454|nr:hypothetical protein [Ornithinimicrobium sp. INDO-MA30-4]UJH69673.1 hypothetical protein L0A91_10085 [Ornithinimicrobium sp. INDO-MA30-4]